MNPIPPRQPEPPPPPPPKEEPPEPLKPEPDDIGNIGDKISDAAEEVVDKVEAYRELLQKIQKDVDEGVDTIRELGKSLEWAGTITRGIPDRPIAKVTNVKVLNSPPSPSTPPIHQPSPEEVANLAVAILSSQSETTDEDVSEPSEESDKSYAWWLPWVVAGGVGIWGLNRKPK